MLMWPAQPYRLSVRQLLGSFLIQSPELCWKVTNHIKPVWEIWVLLFVSVLIILWSGLHHRYFIVSSQHGCFRNSSWFALHKGSFFPDIFIKDRGEKPSRLISPVCDMQNWWPEASLSMIMSAGTFGSERRKRTNVQEISNNGLEKISHFSVSWAVQATTSWRKQ